MLLIAKLRLKTAVSSLVLAAPLCGLFVHGACYFAHSPPLWQVTAANLEAMEAKWAGFAVTFFWCAMLFLFRSVVASVPNKPKAQSATFGEFKYKRLAKATAWLVWFCILSILSLPSILYAVAQSSPSHNTLPLSDDTLLWFHRLAPLLTVFIDVSLADEVSAKYSAWTGIRIEYLLMTFRLFSAWLLALLTTMLLDENCLAGWKMDWSVCHEAEHDIFTWHIFSEEILNTQRDICQSSDTWWSDGRCSRAIVGNLTPFILKKMLVRSAVQPLVYLLLWRCSRLDQNGQLHQGLHLKFFGLKTTGSLVPVQQLPMLTTQMDAWILSVQLGGFTAVSCFAAFKSPSDHSQTFACPSLLKYSYSIGFSC